MNKGGRKAKTTAVVGRRKATESMQERRLLETLQQAETKQLESFIKSRSTELDRDIRRLKHQLKLDDYEGGVENRDLAVKSASSTDLNVRGRGLGHVEFKDDHGSYNQKPAINSNVNMMLESKVVREQPKTNSDQLILLLARMKLKMEDVRISPAQLKELLLPSDLMLPGEHRVSIRDLTGVLQTDLLMPVTKSDQLLLLRAYGTGATDDEVDVRDLLDDAGIWYDGKNDFSHASSPEVRKEATNSGHHESNNHNDRNNMESNDRLVSTLPTTSNDHDHQVKSSKYLLNTYPSGDKHSNRTKEMLDSSGRHLDELAQLHQMILDDGEFDAEPSLLKGAIGSKLSEDSKRLDRNIETQSSLKSGYYGTQSRDTTRRIGLETVEETVSTDDENMTQDKKGHIDTDKATFVSAPVNDRDLKREEDRFVDDRVSALQRENDRLKQEMQSFDVEFFEQLEDLKYRYSKLQEVVGEDPTSVRAVPLTDPRVRGGGLPLDRLSWSVRNAMTAMDRAGLTSPLVSRPVYPHAYTYSPGTELKNSNKGRGAHVGGTMPASITASQSLQQYPPLLTHKGNSSGAFSLGGQHAIGAGTHSIVPDEHGGTFSNLCERRLAFELSQHRTPEQATRSLIHRYDDMRQ